MMIVLMIIKKKYSRAHTVYVSDEVGPTVLLFQQRQRQRQRQRRSSTIRRRRTTTRSGGDVVIHRPSQW